MSATPLIARLNELRRRLTRWIILEGVSHTAAGIVAMIVVDYWIDWSLHMDRAQRFVMLLLIVSGLAAIAYRKLMKPLQQRLTDDALCLQIEEQQPDLKQTLISALQFARAEVAPSGSSLTLRRATIELGSRLAVRIDPQTALDRPRQLRNAVVLIVAGVSLLGTAISVVATDSGAIWFERNILLGQREWPQDIHFHVLGTTAGVLTLPRDEDWPIEIEVTQDSRRWPREVWIEHRDSGRRQRTELLDDGRRFRTDLAGATATTEFRIVEAQAASDWYRVRLVDRPAVTTLQLTVTPPAYTQLPAEQLPPGGGPFQLLKGSRLSLSVTADQPLDSAIVSNGTRQWPLARRVVPDVSSDAASKSLQPVFMRALEAEQLHDGDYRIDLTSIEKLWLPGRSEALPLTSREPTIFRLRTAVDREPQLQAKLTGIGTLVTPRARLPIVGQVTDDFSIVKLVLQHRRRAENDQEDTTGELPIQPHTPLPTKETAFAATLDIESLQVASGTALSFVITATDNNDITGPGVGRSPVFLARVVTDEEFRAALLGRERELRIEFEKHIKFEDELRTDVLAFQSDVRGQAELAVERRDQLVRFERRQKAIREDVLKLARKFTDVVTEIRNNRLEDHDGPLQSRLQSRIAEPLQGLQRESFLPAASILERARLRVHVAADRDRAIGQLVDAQQKLLDRMREILSHMEQAEGFQEAINQLLEVQQAQQEVLKRTEKEKQDAIRKLLDDK